MKHSIAAINTFKHQEVIVNVFTVHRSVVVQDNEIEFCCGPGTITVLHFSIYPSKAHTALFQYDMERAWIIHRKTILMQMLLTCGPDIIIV